MSPTETMPLQLFAAGQIVLSPKVLEALGVLGAEALFRAIWDHERGLWGQVAEEDARAQDEAIAEGDTTVELLSIQGPLWLRTRRDLEPRTTTVRLEPRVEAEKEAQP